MTTLTEFLLTRIAEDESVARDAARAPRYEGYGNSAADEMVILAENEGAREGAVKHGLRHSPKRVLAECEGKRRIVDMALAAEAAGHDLSGTLMNGALAALALPYADHPDYREEWRP